MSERTEVVGTNFAGWSQVDFIPAGYVEWEDSEWYRDWKAIAACDQRDRSVSE